MLFTILMVALVILAFALILVGGILRVRYPLYPTTWTRCHQCFDLHLVPSWEVEGFVCGRCRHQSGAIKLK